MGYIDDIRVHWDHLRHDRAYHDAHFRYEDAQRLHRDFTDGKFYNDVQEHRLNRRGKEFSRYVHETAHLFFIWHRLDQQPDRVLLREAFQTISAFVPKAMLAGLLRNTRRQNKEPTAQDIETFVLEGLKQRVLQTRRDAIRAAEPYYPVLRIVDNTGRTIFLHPMKPSWDFLTLKDFLQKRKLHKSFRNSFFRPLLFNPYDQPTERERIAITIDLRSPNNVIMEEIRLLLKEVRSETGILSYVKRGRQKSIDPAEEVNILSMIEQGLSDSEIKKRIVPHDDSDLPHELQDRVSASMRSIQRIRKKYETQLNK